MTTEEIQLLNELPLEKLLKLKNSLQDFVSTEYNNVTVTEPTFEHFGAQAMALKAPPIKRLDYGGGLYKNEGSTKLSNIFSMSVTTLAFLAFGGYLLCLIVQAVKAKQAYNGSTVSPVLVNAGIKRPQQQFASYGRRKRDNKSVNEMDLPPEELFSALLQVCEGYAQWSERHSDV
ncbi:unnamed protein product [Parnassius apollo]|uniref:(apollo) hypothetical protein n=1 Tax=Parnassius apollo TaxID=110799 RepID=A0A8S3X371_PARAO|nr:unnamed protein product [Parnassius apollo]